MRKIPSELECPLDNFLITAAEPVSVTLNKIGFTPNEITTLSLISGVCAVLALQNGCSWLSALLLGVSYFFDTVDGYYARKYNMSSKFGDCYDHIKDVVVFSAFVVVIFSRNRHKLPLAGWIAVVAILLLFLAASMVYFAAQEKIYDRTASTPTLGWLHNLFTTKEKAEKTLKILRFFGTGTLILATLIFTVWIEHYRGYHRN
jgi:phosphatidylglycerophosphate synthase